MKQVGGQLSLYSKVIVRDSNKRQWGWTKGDAMTVLDMDTEAGGGVGMATGLWI
jgi:hypothetical protein